MGSPILTETQRKKHEEEESKKREEYKKEYKKQKELILSALKELLDMPERKDMLEGKRILLTCHEFLGSAYGESSTFTEDCLWLTREGLTISRTPLDEESPIKLTMELVQEYRDINKGKGRLSLESVQKAVELLKS